MSGLDDLLAQASVEDLLVALEKKTGSAVQTTFSNKAKARRLSFQVRPRVMTPVKKHSFGSSDEQSRNLLIEGDNLQSLVTLYKERGHVDLILTDPPYNTGNDFRYNDKWEDDPNDQGIGDFVSDDDGAKHTKWMSFMYPRLRMMRDMLKPTGVLAICIDYRELFHLGPMLDEIFKEENRLAILNWQRSSTRRNDKAGVSTATEYVLVYAKDKTRAKTGLLERTAKQESEYTNPDNDPMLEWSGVTPFAPGRATHPGMYYAIQSPFTGLLHYPSGTQCWKDEKATVKRELERWGSEYVEVDLGDSVSKGLLLKGSPNPLTVDVSEHDVVLKAREKAEEVLATQPWPIIFFTKKGYGRPRKKSYLAQIKKGVIPVTYWADEDYHDPVVLDSTSWDSKESGTSEAGSRELTKLVGDHGFETVKPLKLFTKIIHLWCPPNGLVIDPFAGSGTAAHAVLQLNAETGSSRRYIMIEQGRPERGDSYAQTLTVKRLRAAISGEWASGTGPALGGGYTFMKLSSKVDGPALLKMERAEMTDVVIFSHIGDGRQRGTTLTPVEGKTHLVATNAAGEGFYLIWEGADENNDFTEDEYEACVQEGASLNLAPVYHVYARRELFQRSGVRYYQIPDRILADFGLDVRSEPFTSEDA